MQIRHLFLSPDHNYFGHHNQPAGDNAVVEVDSVECVAGRGLRGDRFFDFKPEYKGQITFFSWETFEELRRALNTPVAHPQALRRNVITAGIDLNQLIGETFTLQGITFQGAEECRPCYWMDSAIGPGAETWLKGRGGLRAKILTDGVLKVTETA
jgi:MOSC domain-containing protein YiiM